MDGSTARLKPFTREPLTSTRPLAHARRCAHRAAPVHQRPAGERVNAGQGAGAFGDAPAPAPERCQYPPRSALRRCPRAPAGAPWRSAPGASSEAPQDQKRGRPQSAPPARIPAAPKAPQCPLRSALNRCPEAGERVGADPVRHPVTLSDPGDFPPTASPTRVTGTDLQRRPQVRQVRQCPARPPPRPETVHGASRGRPPLVHWAAPGRGRDAPWTGVGRGQDTRRRPGSCPVCTRQGPGEHPATLYDIQDFRRVGTGFPPGANRAAAGS